MRYYTLSLCFLAFLLTHCGPQVASSTVAPSVSTANALDQSTLSAEAYFAKVHGAWQAIMVANHTGLRYEGLYLDEPLDEESITLALLDEWSTDDDTAVEWVDMHILETHGIDPTYEQIRDEWVAHLNHDIWVSTRVARDLMDDGVLPPETGSAQLNPDGVWSIDAQLQTELFGLIAPGLPEEAARRAIYFAKVTNSGLAVDASAFYADMYARAFFEPDVPTLLASAQVRFPADHRINQIVDNVRQWYEENPDDWRETRRLIRDAYDHDPEWWAAEVNFACTILALLYGAGDMIETMTIAGLAGWDADNNMTTAAGLLGLIAGFDGLPAEMRTASDIYFNEDVTGDLPRHTTVTDFVQRTQGLAELVVESMGGDVDAGVYKIQQ